jgi:hypothetical protein
MSTGKKKATDPKVMKEAISSLKGQQEPPIDHEPTATGQTHPDPAPMAAPPPAKEDRLAALELANIGLEKRIAQLERNCRASHGMR